MKVLKDRNGKRIYKGDPLKWGIHYGYANIQNGIWVIVIDDEDGGWGLEPLCRDGKVEKVDFTEELNKLINS